MTVSEGRQNPTPTSKSVRAGNRLTRVSQLRYIPRYRVQLGASVWLTGEVVLGLPHAWGGWVWVWGALLVWGGWAPAWGVGPAGLLVRALGKYLDPVKKGICVALRTPAHGGTKNFRGPSLWLVGARGHE